MANVNPVRVARTRARPDRVLDESEGDGCRGQRQQQNRPVFCIALRSVAQVFGRDDEERPVPQIQRVGSVGTDPLHGAQGPERGQQACVGWRSLAAMSSAVADHRQGDGRSRVVRRGVQHKSADHECRQFRKGLAAI